LTALRSRAVGLEARGAAEAALVDSSPAIRRAGRELLEAIDPEAGLARYLESVGAEGDPGERQHAWRRLGAIDDPRAREAIGQGLARWAAGELDPVVALDVIEAGIASGEGALVARARALLEPSPEAPVESRRWALAGGDPVAGRTVFQTVGDCQRCHGDPAAGADEAGHGGRIGPALTGVAARGPRFALESVLVPDAQIADGFPSPSGMPPVGLVLEPRALRDLVAHLSTLE
jgi:cytochrome c5